MKNLPFACRLLLAAGLVVTGSALAIEETLESCAAVEDLSGRLACYDRVAGRSKPAPQPAAEAPATPISPTPEPAAVVPEPAPVVAAPAVSSDAPPAKAVVSEKEQRFGAESLPRAPGAPTILPDDRYSSITSRITGSFGSSKRGTEYRLENGQVWKSVEILGSADFALTAPIVTIERAALATYQMQVEGIKKRITVRRVQ